MQPLPASVAIAGAWGYIGRKLLEAARRRGSSVQVLDPGPWPADLPPGSVTRVGGAAEFCALPADCFHLALHPDQRGELEARLLARAATEPLWILNEKPMAAPEDPEHAADLVGAVDRSQAVMLFDFPELFDPLTARILEHLAGCRHVRFASLTLERSKDREDPALARNYKRMAPIQYQEAVHCLAYALHLLGSCHGGWDAVLDGGVEARAVSRPYQPPNPEAYPHVVDGRCDYSLRLGGVRIEGVTDFTRGARWSKRRVLEGTADGKPFRIEADYLEGAKFLRIDGVDQGWDPRADSYTAILDTLGRWRSTVSRAALLAGLYPNPRLAWHTYQLSGLLWRSSHEGRRIALAGRAALEAFDSGYAAAQAGFPRYPVRAGAGGATSGED
jgi:predicted dehydrogenase